MKEEVAIGILVKGEVANCLNSKPLNISACHYAIRTNNTYMRLEEDTKSYNIICLVLRSPDQLLALKLCISTALMPCVLSKTTSVNINSDILN